MALKGDLPGGEFFERFLAVFVFGGVASHGGGSGKRHGAGGDTVDGDSGSNRGTEHLRDHDGVEVLLDG